MASINNRRIVALLLQEKLNSLYAEVLPLYALANAWTLNSIDDDLPTEGEVKTVLEDYAALAVPATNTRAAVLDVGNSEETFDGAFAVPSTAFIRPFEFGGPVWGGAYQSQGFGIDLSIVRMTIFAGDTGTPGASGSVITVDAQVDGVSLFSTLPEIAADSGTDVNYVVPDAYFITKSIPASGILKIHLPTMPDDAENITVNVWLQS
jgi:hypothetical protein